MKPLVHHQKCESEASSLSLSHSLNSAAGTKDHGRDEAYIQHKRRRHKAYRQSSNISLYEELANSIEDQHHEHDAADLPRLCSSKRGKHSSLKNLFYLYSSIPAI